MMAGYRLSFCMRFLPAFSRILTVEIIRKVCYTEHAKRQISELRGETMDGGSSSRNPDGVFIGGPKLHSALPFVAEP